MEVIADLREECLGAFLSRLRSLWTQQRCTAAGPHLADSAPKPCIAVDNGEYWRPQPARDEIVEAPFPRRERLTMAQLQGE